MSKNDKYATSASRVERAKAGNEDAWSDMVLLYQNLIAYWIRQKGFEDQATIDEILQESLITIFEKIEGFTVRPGMRSLRPWMKRVVEMECLNQSHRRNRDNKLIEHIKQDVEWKLPSKDDTSDAEEKAAIDETDEQEDEQEKAILRESTINALHKRTNISKRDLRIFYQCTCTNRRYADIADEFQLATGNVATIKRRVLSQIKGNERYTSIAREILKEQDS